MKPINIMLPDGSIKVVNPGTPVFEVAQGIGRRLAEAALLADGILNSGQGLSPKEWVGAPLVPDRRARPVSRVNHHLNAERE